MPKFKPFKAVRPAKGLEKDIAALPYDVVDRQGVLDELSRRPISFLKIDRPDAAFDENHNPYAKDVYEKGADFFNEYLKDGKFITENKDCFYIYEQTMDGRTQTGIVGCSSVDDYINDKIKKHEFTRKEKEDDRVNHVDSLNANTGPIFLTFKDEQNVTQLLENLKAKYEPLFDFSLDEIRQRGFIVTEPEDIDLICEKMADVNAFYIADGHHRAASAVRVAKMRREENPAYNGNEEFNFFLSIVFPANELKIYAYNRILKSKKPIENIAKLAEENFEVTAVENLENPTKKRAFLMFDREKSYNLVAKDDLFENKDIVGSLDVSILQDYFLNPVFEIKDPRTDQNIDFVGGIYTPQQVRDKLSENEIAFCLYGVSTDELMQIADEGKVMPPKSTWFEPKLLSGLFIHLL
ncbi:MAG: DUF1015 domain-containing protein [Clostridia bacterium]|nr:DUF1015 domain-containing protein [Clostridia bacterium]